MADALEGRMPEGVALERVDCMNQCDTPVSLALRGEGRDVYLFAGVDPVQDVEDAVALARLYAEASGGTITDARAAGRLRFCLTGRVPG